MRSAAVPAGTPHQRCARLRLIALAVIVLLPLMACGIETDTGSEYPEFCAAVAKLDAVPADSDSVVNNAQLVTQVLTELEQLPSSQTPVEAPAQATSLRTELTGWLSGEHDGYYDPATFTPKSSSIDRWRTAASQLASTIEDSCDTAGVRQFFAAGGPQAPTTTAPLRPVAGWAIPGIRTLCVDTDASFANQALPREQILTLVFSSIDTPHLLTTRRIVLASVGQPCDATLSIAFTGTALSGNYERSGTLYTGATANGTLTLSAPDQPDLVIPMHHREDPPAKTFETKDDLPTTPADALHHTGLTVAVKDALDQWFGPLTP